MALAGAGQVVAALRSLGHRVTVVDTCSGVLDEDREAELLAGRIEAAPPGPEQLNELAAREDLVGCVSLEEVSSADLVFLVLHGRQGEGGAVQTLLEMASVRFTGSDSVGSVLAMDKDVAKRLMVQADVATPDWRVWTGSGAPSRQKGSRSWGLEDLSYPVVVKPSRVGSSVGLTVAGSSEEVGVAIETALAFDQEVLIERMLPGRELTVGVLGGEALGVGEIKCQSGIFDFHGKYTAGVVEEIFPADLPAELELEVRELALSVHRALKLRDFSRVDFRLDENGRPSCLEANTLPGMTSMSLLPQSASLSGWDFVGLCQRIVELGQDR